VFSKTAGSQTASGFQSVLVQFKLIAEISESISLMSKNPFVVRVYGIYINDDRQVLLSDEYIYSNMICKFPGGGLEFGEGTRDCLRREMMEETGQEFEVLDHFYTTDFFVPSAFNPELQVFSIYYRMKPVGELKLATKSRPFDFEELVENAQSFRWVSLDEISPIDLTLPIDQKVGELLRDLPV
jgi:8-oxo-dGTP diphosphatase